MVFKALSGHYLSLYGKGYIGYPLSHIGYHMGLDLKSWALNWLKGSFVSYLRGATSERIILGRIKRCLESYGISLEEVRKLAISITLDPSLNLGPTEEQQERLDKLLRKLENVSFRMGGK